MICIVLQSVSSMRYVSRITLVDINLKLFTPSVYSLVHKNILKTPVSRKTHSSTVYSMYLPAMHRAVFNAPKFA